MKGKQEMIFGKKTQVYLNTVQECVSLMEREPLKEEIPERIFGRVNDFLKYADSVEFQIAFVGTIKAGKSTLINALLGWDYASVHATPETAVLTKFCDSGSDTYTIHAEFYNEKEWNAIWKEAMEAEASADVEIQDRIAPFLKEYRELKADSVKNDWLNHEALFEEYQTKEELAKGIVRLTSSKSSLHYFVKEVKVGIKESGLPPRVVLCDTPGLDDVLSYRSNVTKQYIDSANVVFVCVLSKFLSGEQYHTIQSVFGRLRFTPERVYIVGTQVDVLGNPLEDWKATKLEWIKYLEGESGFGSRELANSHIVGVSANIEIFLRKNPDFIHDLDAADDFRYYARRFGCLNRMDIDESKRKLQEADGVRKLMNKIQKEVFSKYQEQIELQMEAEYLVLKEEILSKMRSVIEGIYEFQSSLREQMEDGKSALEEIEEKVKYAEKMKKQRNEEMKSQQEEGEYILKMLRERLNTLV